MAIASIEKLTTQLARLPGVGRKTAQRLAYHLLSVPKEQATELAEAIADAREKVHPCPVCGAFTDLETCEICADPKRTEETVCVVLTGAPKRLAPAMTMPVALSAAKPW